MNEKDDVVFDADVYRRLEFLERRHNEIVDETFGARQCATAFAGVLLCIMIFIVVWTLVFPLLPTPETPPRYPANVGELVKTLETVDPETPLEKKDPRRGLLKFCPRSSLERVRLRRSFGRRFLFLAFGEQ